MGVNTNGPFVINGTQYSTSKHGRLEKVAVDDLGFAMLPDYMIKKQFDAYVH